MRSRICCLATFLVLVLSLGAWCEEANRTSEKEKDEKQPLSSASRLMRRPPDPTTNLNGPQKGWSTTVVIPAYVPAHDKSISHHRHGYDAYEYQYDSQWWYYYQSNPYGYVREVEFHRDMGDAMVAEDFERDMSIRENDGPIVRPASTRSAPVVVETPRPAADANVRVISGRVTAIANGTVLLDSGDTFRISDTTPVVFSDSTTGKRDDLRQGVNVKVVLSPVSDVVYCVEVLAG